MKKHRKVSSIFQLIDRKIFDNLVAKWEMDKGVRSFSTWELTCALLSIMTMGLGSYRDVEKSLGIPHSTLSDAMEKRWYGFFQDLCDAVLNNIRTKTLSRKVRRAIGDILAIDSSEIKVNGSMFNISGWAQKKAVGHQAAGKLHVVWNADGEWIEGFEITGGRKNDSPVSLRLQLLPNKTYVFDRAYNDMAFWLKIITADSHFVTRLKMTDALREIQARILASRCREILSGAARANLLVFRLG